MKKFLIFNDEICNIMPSEDLRTNWKDKLGLEIKAQTTHKDPIISIFEVIDENKAFKYFNHPKVTIIDETQIKQTVDQLFSDYPEYALTDSTALLIDLQLSGLTDVPGYNKNKPLTSQENLQVLYNAGLSGIIKREKPKIE